MADSAKLDRRVQFDVLPDRLKELDQLMALCDLRTRKDLFDHAMTLFEWAVYQVRDGNEIATYNKATDAVSILKMPPLDKAARRVAAVRPFAVASKDENPSEEGQGAPPRRGLSKASALG